jgi:glucose/arabinose dehydrogenase
MAAGGGSPRTWFDIRTIVPGFSDASNPGQTGLMSFAFHPNFAGDPTQPGFGVFYTIDTSRPSGAATLSGKGTGTDHDNVLHEFRVADPRAADAEIVSQREVMRVAQPLSDHGPGTIAFNPTAKPGSADYGKLYIGFGDGGGVGDPYGNAQDPTSPLGKILRIDPARGAGGQPYTIPADNPAATTPGALGEVWASGLRNPQQFSWNADTGQMLIADIGQSQLEEVNVGVAGGNYGWPAREGSFARGASWDPNVYDTPANTGGFLDPLAQFDHEEIFRSGQFGLAAISGVFAYTGSLVPELSGMTVLSELVSGRLFYFDPLSATGGQSAALRELGLSFDGLDTTMIALDGNPWLNNRVDLRMGTDADGEIFLLSKSLGNIYRLTSLGAVPEPASWLMMIAGAGLIGGALRRRRVSGVAGIA